jgi:lysophospholipase L1-like esterase
MVLCLLLPVSDYTQHKQTDHRPPSDILRLNEWLRRYAAEFEAEVADYYSVLVDSKGMLKEGYSDDGLHPNDRGYMLMAPVAEAAIERALRSKK